MVTEALTLGASRFSAAIGVNPYKSRKKLWRQMTGAEEETEVSTEILEWGRVHEQEAVAHLSAVTGEVFDGVFHQRKFIAGSFHATPDGFYGRTGCEVKVRTDKAKEKLWADVPAHYMCQVQGQCMVCKFNQVYFGCYYPHHNGHVGRVWLVERSEEFIQWMEPLLHEFVGFVERHEEPPRLVRKPVIPLELCRTVVIP